MEKMKALMFFAPKDARIIEIPRPEPARDQALVRILKAGICGGDYHYYDGTSPYAHYPHVYGHEMVGIVEKVCGQCALHEGDMVTGEIILPCGKCFACRHQKPNCCSNMGVVGQYANGIFSEYAVYPLCNLHKLPDGLDADDGVLVEPYSIGHHIAHRAPVQEGETVLVIGCGTIGLTVIDVLKTMGTRVIAADLSASRRAVAMSFGADSFIDAAKTDMGAEVLRLTDDEGVAVVYEATGSTQVMSTTTQYVASGGSIVIAGITGKPVTLDGLQITKKELSIFGSRNAYGDFERVIELFHEGKLHQRQLITRRVPMERAPEAFRELYEDHAAEIKVVLEWPER